MLPGLAQAAMVATPVQHSQLTAKPALPFAVSAPSTSDVFSAALQSELNATGLLSPKTAAIPLPGTTLATPKTATEGKDDKKAEGEISAQKAEEIDSVARDLEAVLLYSVLKEMWATIPENKLTDGGSGAKMYREMWLEEVSKRVAHDGNGLGLSTTVKRELLDRARREVTPAQLQAAGK